MKVLHVEAGRHLYGGALQVVFLLRGLRDLGGEHVLACPEGSAVAEAARPYAARVHEIPMGGDLDWRMMHRLRRLIRSERPDVVHLHSRRGSDLWGGLAARRKHVPVVLSRRVDNPEPRWLVAMKYRLFDRVITISDGIRDVLLAEGVPPEKVVCVHSAVDTDRYRPDCRDQEWFRAAFSLSEDERTVGMAAQFIPRKGHRTLVEAMPAILASHPRTRFLLFGQGPELPAIRQLVEARGLMERVVFAGFRDDLHRILPCLDLLVHPASMEGLGVILLQAAACGIPIVAGRAGGIPEAVHDGENGLLVPPEDAGALAEATHRLLTDPALAEGLGQHGRTLMLEAFSIGEMARGNLRVYQSLLT